MFDEKTRLEISVQHPWCEILNGPGGGSALTDGLYHFARVQPGSLGIENRLTRTHHRGRDEDLIGHLGMLPRAGITHENDGSPHDFK